MRTFTSRSLVGGRRRASSRRGITLLFVVSLILLFLLMGTSFVLLARQYRNSAVAGSRIDTRIDDARSMVQRVFYDILREPAFNQVDSPFRGTSLLGDQYGYGMRGTVYSARMLNDQLTGNFDGGGQIFAFRLDSDADPTNGDQLRRILDNQLVPVSDNSGEYEGQVLTFVSGPLAGTSIRILAYQVAEPVPGPPPPGQLFYHEFWAVPGSAAGSVALSGSVAAPVNQVGQLNVAALIGSEVVINGRDYSGTGAGLFTSNQAGTPAAMRRGMEEARLVAPNTVNGNGIAFDTQLNAVFGPNDPPGTPRLNLRDVSPSLLPNRIGESADEFRMRYLSQTLFDPAALPPSPYIGVNSASTNEDYDALTEQDMYLSGEWVERWPVLANTAQALGPKVVPSFYRPELVRYFNLVDQAGQYPQPGPPPPAGLQATSNDLAFDLSGRPRRDHFLANLRNPDGSPYYQDLVDNHSLYYGLAGGATVPNLTAQPIAGQGDGIPDRGWDVDNDGDGIRDSIWMPSGLPTVTDVSGRRLMPLVAVKIVDMDGRLNANAHGNLTQRDVQANRFKTAQNFLGGMPGVFQGQGYGPPEVMFSSLLPPLGTPLTGGPRFSALVNPAVEVPNLLRGAMIGGQQVLGRYGQDQVPGIAGRDPSAIYRHYTWPDRIFDPARGLLGNGYSSAMDAHGRISWGVPNDTLAPALAIDPYDAAAGTFSLAMGMPVIDMVASPLTTEVVNVAYETDFSRSPFSASANSADTPFSPREMEALLRRNDRDSYVMAPRLRQLLATSFGTSDADLEKILTTESNEVPVPPASLVDRLRRALGEFSPATFGDWPRTAASAPLTIAQNTAAIREIQKMLAPEVIQGRRMDLNFPLGNGLDDNGNGLVDEAEESVRTPAEMRPDPYGRNIPMDYDSDANATTDVDHLLARQNMARRLYVLVLLTTQYIDRNGDGSVDLADWFDYNNSTIVDVDDLRDYRRDVAQWAANIVEFRDPDAISTGYEFDLNPWNGWGLDGRVETNTDTSGSGLYPDEATADRFVVWGAERPELLLTETFLAHARRTQDLNTDSTGQFAASEPGAPPEFADLDSQLVPNASCFVELYNPWYRGGSPPAVGNTDAFPAEFYGATGVALNRMDASGRSPIWRVVGSGYSAALGRETDLRTVYFARPQLPAQQAPGGGNVVFFPDSALAIPEITPGQYAVLGSAGVESSPGVFTTYLGRRTTPTWNNPAELAQTRSITLEPASSRITIRWWDDSTSSWQDSRRRNVVAIPVARVENGTPIGAVRPFGLTDPAIGYEQAAVNQDPMAGIQAIEDGFEIVNTTVPPAPFPPLTLDQPLDHSAGTEWSEFYSLDGTSTGLGIRDNGLHRQVRRVRLERLANPLTRWNPEVGEAGHDPARPVNPYIVVDVIGADVSVFNGVTNDEETDTTAAPPPAGQFARTLYTFERSTNRAIAANFRNLWLADPRGRQNALATVPDLSAAPPQRSMFANTDEHFVSENLHDTLGECDLAWRGAQLDAFPWLTWNNRPFVSQLELASVPHGISRPVRSGEAFRVLLEGNLLLNRFDLHRPPSVPMQSWYGRPNNGGLGGRFAHLPDMLLDRYSLNQPAQDAFAGTPGLHRMLDYIEVPSRFVGTDLDLNPIVFADTWNDVAPDGTGSDLGFRDFKYNPPYNTVSRFRYPGKVNLNTVFSQRVWSGVMGDYATPTGFLSLADSRRDQNVKNSVTFVNSAVPPPPVPPVPQDLFLPSTMPFAYRAADRGNFVSEVFVHPALNSFNNPNGLTADSLVLRSGQTGLFRAVNPAAPDLNPATNLPMFDFTNGGIHADPNRSAYFRYDERQRLGNLTTHRSSVFAIWITVGFFEMDDNGNPVAIEGAPRQRGFYLIDRSIPVAFEPGNNHNVDRVILTSSIIE